MEIITRFAPSPTGRLHLGHAWAAHSAFSSSEGDDTKVILRMEDIDYTRCRPEFTDGIFEDLSWLGYSWQTPIRTQSQHYSDYAKVVIDLLQRGLAYGCTLSRSDLNAGKRTIAPDSPSHSETGRICERLRRAAQYKTPSFPFAVRLNLNAALRRVPTNLPYTDGGDIKHALPPLVDWAAFNRPDPIIARRDIATSYHIAVTHDDHLQGITRIVRGEDLQDQTPLHVLIQHLMGWETPRYGHHPLITDETGRKLSKTHKDLTIQFLRESGMSPDDVLSLARGLL